MVIGLPIVSVKDGVCFGCVLEKRHRDSFDKCASWHAWVPLELVHVNYVVLFHLLSFLVSNIS